jgi:glutamate---cysteine ligase / carboxylate-amine ligase
MASAAAVAGLAHALVSRLAEAEPPPPTPTWRIEENRWSALRHGVEGAMVDLLTGRRMPTRQLLDQLISDAEPYAPGGLAAARALVQRNTANRLRGQGLDGALRWLTERFLG